MHRIDSDTAQLDKFGPGKHGYTEGDPLNGEPATATTDDALDALQEEPARVIEHVGHVLDKADHTQLLHSVLGLVQSANAVRWSAHLGGPVGDAVRAGCGWFIPGNVILVGDNGGVYLVGESLADTETPPTSADLLAVDAGAGAVCAVGEAGTIVRSTEGTWPAFSTPSSGVTVELRGIAVGNTPAGTRWVAVGADGTILRSSDNGLTWSTSVSGVSSALNAVIWLPDPASLNEIGTPTAGVWVAVGDAGVILTSEDGSSWARATTSLTGAHDLHHVAGGWGWTVRRRPLVLATGSRWAWTYDLETWDDAPNSLGATAGHACSRDGTVWVGAAASAIWVTTSPRRGVESVPFIETGGAALTGVVWMGGGAGRFLALKSDGSLWMSDLIVR